MAVLPGSAPVLVMVAARDTHEARSAMGYLFQCRYALLLAIQAIPDTPQLEIAIEKFDDVSFQADGEPTHLIQTKHHIGRTGNLTDASVDLWKTLLVWSKRVADVEAPFRTKFMLLTTGLAPDGSAASFLRMRNRDETEADRLLMQAASTSRNQDNAAAYKAYKALPETVRLALLRAVFVLDGSPNWPAPGSEDTELGVLMELEVGHGETEVYARVQA